MDKKAPASDSSIRSDKTDQGEKLQLMGPVQTLGPGIGEFVDMQSIGNLSDWLSSRVDQEVAE